MLRGFAYLDKITVTVGRVSTGAPQKQPMPLFVADSPV
jgi:hypothetical protein